MLGPLLSLPLSPIILTSRYGGTEESLKHHRKKNLKIVMEHGTLVRIYYGRPNTWCMMLCYKWTNYKAIEAKALGVVTGMDLPSCSM